MFDETPVLSSLLDMQACTILVYITLLPASKAVLFGSKGKGIYLVLVKLGAIHMSRCVQGPPRFFGPGAWAASACPSRS